MLDILDSEILIRKNCCVCGSENLNFTLKIENFPVYMGVTTHKESNDQFFDQTWNQCTDCGCLQLLNLLPVSTLYEFTHTNEVVGQIWEDHHDVFANFIANNMPRKILEIGAAHGYLANKLTEKLVTSEYTIIEPSTSLANSRIKIIKGFIEEHLSELQDKDCIIHSHVLEHVYKPVEFINQISSHTLIGADMYISFPNMDGLINSGGLNSLNFEHTYLLNPEQAELIFENAGFLIVKKEDYLSHSHFYHLKKKDNISKIPLQFPNIGKQSIEFLKMVDSLKGFVSSTNKYIDSHKGGVYIFGAHIFSQSFITLGLKTEKILGILDNSKSKQNKRLYGTPFRVFDPSVISGAENVVVILNASHYQTEIRNQLISINENVRIIEN